MQDSNCPFDYTTTSDKPLELLLNSKLSKLIDAVLNYNSLYRAEQKRFTSMVKRLMEAAGEKDIAAAKKTLLTITDFVYSNMFRLDENPFTGAVIGLDSKDGLETVIKDVTEDINGLLGQLNIFFTYSVNETENTCKYTFSLRDICNNHIKIELGHSSNSHFEASQILEFAVFENGIRTAGFNANDEASTVQVNIQNSCSKADLSVRYAVNLIDKFKSDSLNNIMDYMSLLKHM